MLEQPITRLTTTPLEDRDERSMKFVEYAMAFVALLAAGLLAVVR